RIVNKRIETPRAGKKRHYMAKNALQKERKREKRRERNNKLSFGHKKSGMVQPSTNTADQRAFGATRH
ncbi:unnamed protein product, partial [Sphenostylis stenocarpa]